jgi:hypothetical protein
MSDTSGWALCRRTGTWLHRRLLYGTMYGLGAGAARPLYCFFRMVTGWEPIGLSFSPPTSGYTLIGAIRSPFSWRDHCLEKHSATLAFASREDALAVA